MRLQIHFSLSGKEQLLPYNYQYPVSSWIYKVLNKGDAEFATFLHENGYLTDSGKQFKLFTFSTLRFPKGTTKKSEKFNDRMVVRSKNGWIDISFYLPEQMQPFVMGLFKDQNVRIGDKKSAIEMQVQNVEVIKPEELAGLGTITLRTRTAVVLGKDDGNEKYEQYINPLDTDYEKLMVASIVDKCGAAGIGDITTAQILFRVGKVKTKTSLQTIKADTAAETKVRGFYYDFQLTAPVAVHALILSSGIGSMNSLGFGMCELVGSVKE